MKTQNIISIVLRLLAAGIMLQTLYFKFTAQPESVYIFSAIGIEPWGRIATGVAELIASVLLLIPSSVAIGAVLGVGIMAGAIVTHVAILGIEVQGDHGQLFTYAVVVMVCCLLLIMMYRNQLRGLKEKFLKV